MPLCARFAFGKAEKLTEEYPSTPSMGTGDGANSVVVHARHTTQRKHSSSQAAGMVDRHHTNGRIGSRKGTALWYLFGVGGGGGLNPLG